MTKGLFALLVAGTLAVPHISPALGDEGMQGTVGLGSFRDSQLQERSWNALPLPPVPHLETMPWLMSDSLLRGPKVDLLIGPKPETIGPFLVQQVPAQTFSSGTARANTTE